MNSRWIRLATGLTAGIVTVVLFDRFVWPGTLLPGFIGVVSAVTVLSLATRKA